MGILNLLQQAAPSTPATNTDVLYFKSDGLLYWKDPSGTEYKADYQSSVLNVNPLSGVAGTNTVTASGNPTITALQAGQISSFVPANSNSGGVTLQIDATTAKSVLKKSASGLVALTANDLVALCEAVVIYDGTQYQLINPAGLPTGTDGYKLTGQGASASVYLPPDQGFSLVNGYLDWTVAASALTVAIKGWDGNDPSATNPVYAVVRDVTATTGLPVLIKITAANSVVVSSGSTLGTVAAAAFRVWAVLFNDAGTYRLGVINCLSTAATAQSTGREVTGIYPLAGWGIASSTAEGGAGAADSAATFYTGTAVASKPYTVLGYATFESGQATAGTWATAASRKQLWGPSVTLPGGVVQTARNSDGARVSTATAIPFDDTIPQNTEGVQVMTQAITPTSGANALVITHSGMYGLNVANDLTSVALFQDSAASAFAANSGSQSTGAGGSSSQAQLEYWILAQSTASTTWKVRAGPTGNNSSDFNGTSSTRRFGGIANSWIKIQEIMG